MIGTTALTALKGNAKPSDVALGLTWLLLRDPLDPLSYDFAGRTEELMKSSGMLQVVPQPTQWNAFRRWAAELGIANRASSEVGPRLVVSARTAIGWGTPHDRSDATPVRSGFIVECCGPRASGWPPAERPVRQGRECLRWRKPVMLATRGLSGARRVQSNQCPECWPRNRAECRAIRYRRGTRVSVVCWSQRQ